MERMPVTRATVRERLRAFPGATGAHAARQCDAILDAAIDAALRALSEALPQPCCAVLPLGDGCAWFPLAALPGVIAVRRIEPFPLCLPVLPIAFAVEGAGVQLLGPERTVGAVQVSYAAAQTLDGAGTSLGERDLGLLVVGAAARVVRSARAGNGFAVPARLQAEARAQEMAFRQLLAHYAQPRRARMVGGRVLRSRHVSAARGTLR
jgi:hypothetical protein